ncbi:MAG: DUF3617 domain-containing protein [Methylococcales bacterium]|nr:DUF3617 domain-containing protein [Methylococcaceae bacterium]
MKFKLLTLPLVLLTISTLAQAEPLNVKPGLWETTTTIEKRSAKPPNNLDKLTPEQREKVEQQLAARVKKETHTVKSCLKEEQINSGEAFAGGTHNGACTHTFATQTANEQIASLDCKGANPMSGKVEMHSEDPEQMTGTITMTYGPNDKLQLLTTSEITAKWLGSDCGKVDNVAPSNPHGKKAD